MLRRIAATISVLAVIGVAGVGAWQWLVAQSTSPGPSTATTTVIIAKGAHLHEIADQLAEAGAVESAWQFMAEAWLAGNPVLRAGEFAFPPRASVAAIIDVIHRGQVVEHRLTVPEGLTVRQIVALLDHADALRGGISHIPPEGSLLPQTYFYVYGDGRDVLLGRMGTAMAQAIDTLWAARAPDLPLADKQQALALASIVERETSIPAERAHVAAVYENRLRVGMKLESDPTVIYAVSNGEGVLDRPISRADLALSNPYNTYANEGLPPGPICNPGRASIEATLHPVASDDLYFVADGTGGHAFAKTLAQHNKNVEKWRAFQKGGKSD